MQFKYFEGPTKVHEEWNKKTIPAIGSKITNSLKKSFKVVAVNDTENEHVKKVEVVAC